MMHLRLDAEARMGCSKKKKREFLCPFKHPNLLLITGTLSNDDAGARQSATVQTNYLLPT